jgi:guanylate kinase
MHKAVKHYRTQAFLKKLFRIKSPSDNVRRLERVMEEYKTEHEYKVLRVNNQTKKALQRLKKALKEM